MFTIRYPEDLPICARREEIVAALRAHQVLIVAGETGSGKTTQLPKMCLDAGLAERGKIGCTQPRRVAAMSVSRRVAEELGVTWGREVGCKMRFADDTGRDTRVKFMTDGILLAEIQSDPMLRAYSTLILDEAHERSLNIDFLLGYLQGLLKKRGDLKLVVTSATIDTEAFSRAFGGAPIIEVSGRLYPVDVRYQPVLADADTGEDPTHVEAAVRATEDALIESDFGDVLVFMPTERDIRETRELLEGSLGSGIEVLGLFGRMPAAEQQRIFAPGERRRVIVATNVAETSITLPRIRYVIDTGFARMSRYNPRTRTKRLPVEAISQSSANQRAGRAGRVQDGVCIRLYEQEDFEKRPRFTQPEIQRANLAEVILRMKAFALGDIETFPFIDPPIQAAVRAGYVLLHELGALNDANNLTGLGVELASLPLDPTLGRMLLQARAENSLPEMLIIAAGLSVPDPRERPEDAKEAAAAAHRAFADPDSDFFSLLNIWRDSPDAESKGGGNALRRFCKANFLSVARMREWRDIHRQLAEAMGERGAVAGAGWKKQTLSSRAERSEVEGPLTSAGGGGAELNRRNARGPSTSFLPPSPARNSAQDDRGLERRGAPEGASYTAIHRAILTGLLGQIAQRQEKNTYKASGNRLVTLFPGSNLYERREKPKKNAGPAKPEAKTQQPPWIVAGEIVETSQLFARSVAGIDPEWVVDLGAHLCERRYTEPHWSAKAGRVLALERVLVHGLEITRKDVDYGRIDPEKATELFIRGALVNEEARIPLRFFEENQKLRDKIENALTRVRSRRAHDLDEALYLFYAARITNVSSVHDLNKLFRERVTREPDFLCATEEDLIGDHDASYNRIHFPDAVPLGNTALPLTYAYQPGEESDGVTVRVPLPVAAQLTSAQVQWMVPGLREEQIGVLLRALPKSVRKPLMPLEPKIREVATEFQPGAGDFFAALADFLSRKYRVTVRAEDWPAGSLPAHLQPRVEVIDRHQRTVASSRDLKEIHATVESRDVRSGAWDRAVKQWERSGVVLWDFGDLPEEVEVEKIAGVPALAFLGLQTGDQCVAIRLFKKRDDAAVASTAAVRQLAELVLARDLAGVWKELAGFAKHIPSTTTKAAGFQDQLAALSAKLSSAPAPYLTGEVLQKSANEHLLAHTLTLRPIFPLTTARFTALVETARRELPTLTYQLGEAAKRLLTLRAAIVASPKRYATFDADLARLLPPDFLARTPPEHLPHLHRYLRGVQIRAERAVVSPAKDAEKAKQLIPFRDWQKHVAPAEREHFRWLLEEFRVSLFAQELGTAQPVSAQRLLRLIEGAG